MYVTEDLSWFFVQGAGRGKSPNLNFEVDFISFVLNAQHEDVFGNVNLIRNGFRINLRECKRLKHFARGGGGGGGGGNLALKPRASMRHILLLPPLFQLETLL